MLTITCQGPKKIYPTGAELDSMAIRSGDYGDNYFSTWGSDGAIYTTQCDGWGWFDGTQLIWSPKGDTKWMRWNGTDAGDRDRWLLNEGGNQLMFFNEPDYAFSFISVAQFRQDYQENKDGYVYLYAPEGKLKSASLNMARVKKEDLLDRDKWEYFTLINELV